MNFHQTYTAYSTLVRKEVVRFIRIWPQTLIPPIITQTLYFLIFGKFIGAYLKDVHGISYMAFLVPGLVMMSIINNGFANVAGSFFSTKFQRSIEELLVSPMPDWTIMAGYVTGGMLRGIVCGILVFVVSFFFIRPVIAHLGFMLIFMVLTSIVFALGGLLNGILAKKFDDISIFPTFVLTPLTYLGGIFYSLNSLSPFWQEVSKFNPILYMINGFRYGFYGFSDVSIGMSLAILVGLMFLLIWVNLDLLRRGTGLRT